MDAKDCHVLEIYYWFESRKLCCETWFKSRIVKIDDNYYQNKYVKLDLNQRL